MKNGLIVGRGGNKCWYLNDNFHRADGPAIECTDGYKGWFINGKLHRVDGPAIERHDGYKCWYIDGKFLPEKEFDAHPKRIAYLKGLKK